MGYRKLSRLVPTVSRVSMVVNTRCKRDTRQQHSRLAQCNCRRAQGETPLRCHHTTLALIIEAAWSLLRDFLALDSRFAATAERSAQLARDIFARKYEFGFSTEASPLLCIGRKSTRETPRLHALVRLLFLGLILDVYVDPPAFVSWLDVSAVCDHALRSGLILDVHVGTNALLRLSSSWLNVFADCDPALLC